MAANTQILNNYLGLINTLSPSLKLELIEKLLKSIKRDPSSKSDSISKSFGAWKGSRDADEIIADIRNSRTFNRKTESF